MANSSQFLVSMKFVGVDALSPEVKKITDQVKNLKTQVNGLGSGPSGGFKWLDTLSSGLQKASSYLDDMQKKFDKMKSSGFGDILTGTAMLAPVLKALDSAGQMQTKMTTIQGSTGANTNDLKAIQQSIRTASNVTKFSTSDVADIAVKLATSGMSAAQVQQLTPIMAKFAEVQNFGKNSSPDEAVTQAVSAAHMLGIYDPTKLDSFLNNFNKATFMTPGSTSEFFDTFKYLAPTATGMGMSNQDILYTAGLANRVGLLGSMGGTEAADMILRSIPGIFGGMGHTDSKGRFKPSQQLKAMMDLGLAKADGSSVFFNDQGKFKGIQNFIDQLAQHTKDVNPEQLMKDYKAMFGMQGERLAVIFGQRGGEQLQVIQKQTDGMKSITQMQDDYNKTYEGQLAQFKTNLQNLNQDVGGALLPLATQTIQAWQPYVSQASSWINTHQQEVIQIAKVTAEVGGMILALGAAKVVIGALGSFITPILKIGPNLGSAVLDSIIFPIKNKILGSSVQPKELPTQAIQANIVNVYGKEIIGGVGGGSGGSTVVSESAANTTKSKGKIVTSVAAAGGILKGAAQRGKAILPVTMALGAYNVLTAPEGQKVQTAVKTSGDVIGGWAGAEAGAALLGGIGTAVAGPAGTVAGAAIGGIIGGIAGSAMINKLTDSLINWHSNAASAPNSNIKLPSFNFSNSLFNQASGGHFQDYSTNNYYINSTDPKGAAQEIGNIGRKSWLRQQ